MKKYTTIILALIVILLLPIQTYGQGFEKIIDLGAQETGFRIVSSDTGFVIAGSISQSNQSGFYLTKVDGQGQVIWSTFNYESLSITGFVKAANGDFIFCGWDRTTSANTLSYVARYSASGDSIWLKYYNIDVDFSPFGLVETELGNIIVCGQNFDTSTVANYSTGLLHVGGNGDSLNFYLIERADTFSRLLPMIYTTVENNYLVSEWAASSQISSPDMSFVLLDNNMDTVWTKHFQLPDIEMPMGVTQTSDSGFVVTGTDLILGLPGQKQSVLLAKFDKHFNLLWKKQYPFPNTDYKGLKVIEQQSGDLFIIAISQGVGGQGWFGESFILTTDAAGNLLSQKHKQGPNPATTLMYSDVVETPGGYMICGGIGQGHPVEPNSTRDIYLSMVDSLGNIFPGRITGSLYFDSDSNCVLNAGEYLLGGWIVQVTGSNSYFAYTDTAGKYSIECDTGTYTLSTVEYNAYWNDNACPDSTTVVVQLLADTINRNYALTPLVNCPAMDVNITAPFLRRCIAAPPYLVSYCNRGTETALNAHVEITLDTFLVMDSASLPHTVLPNGLYRFDLGNVNSNVCGSFVMYLRTDCSSPPMGGSYCVKAEIFPDTICTPPSSNWDGANLMLSSECLTDSLQFHIRNTGNGMQAPLAFIIIQDDVLYANNTIQLNAGELRPVRVPANGATWTLATSQTPHHPIGNMPILSVEACGTNSQGFVSWGFLQMFPQDDGASTVDILCLRDIFAYDPNDKTPEPKGIGTEGFIDEEQRLNYRIRFQNTGTDTAFTVVVQDTLSPLLDMSTLKIGGASHPYTFQIKPGNVLEFTFNNILLPDSNINEPLSHGYLSFAITPLANLGPGTEITNTAYIYFDRNEAIITNTTLNTIGELFKTWLTISDINDPEKRVAFYPNPTQGLLSFTVDGVGGPVEVNVLSLQGQKVMQRNYYTDTDNKQPLQLDMGELPQGIYLMQVSSGAYTSVHRVVLTR